MNAGKSNFVLPDKDVWSLGNDIHIWRWPVTRGEFHFLSTDEMAKAERFRFEADRLRFSTGRHFTRWLLSKYMSVDPLSIDISILPGIKPVLKNPLVGIHFNISHSGEWVLIAFANREVGVDVEKIDTAYPFSELLEEHFNEAEKSFILNADRPIHSFYKLWTRKEALIKSWGTGLVDNLKDIHVLDGEVVSQNLHWYLKTITISEDYQAAVAYRQPMGRIFYLEGSK